MPQWQQARSGPKRWPIAAGRPLRAARRSRPEGVSLIACIALVFAWE
jgi:hypothetical protein